MFLISGAAKQFFFKKKNQKTFVPHALSAAGLSPSAPEHFRRQKRKVFWSFFSKKDCLPILILALSGCASEPQSRPVGQDFSRAAFEAFTLNQTSVAEVEAVLGTPVKQTSVKGMAKPTATAVPPGSMLSFTTLNYFYAPDGYARPGQQRPAKQAVVIFLNDRLQGYVTNSTIPGDANLPIDEGRLGALRQGVSTRADAIGLLGMPNMQTIHLLDSPRGSVDIGYDWGRADRGTITVRTLRIHFGPDGRLTTYRLVDSSFPLGSTPIPYPRPHLAPPNPSPALPGMEPMPQRNDLGRT